MIRFAGVLDHFRADHQVLSDSLAIHDDGALVAFYNAAGPIFCCEREDRAGLRLGAVIVIDQGLAGIGAVAEAVSLHRTTLSDTAAAVGMSRRGLRHAGDRGFLVRPQPRV